MRNLRERAKDFIFNSPAPELLLLFAVCVVLAAGLVNLVMNPAPRVHYQVLLLEDGSRCVLTENAVDCQWRP